MKIKLTFAAITVVALTLVACEPVHPAPHPGPPPKKTVTVLPKCVHKDGSGQGACLWTDPNTGKVYRNN